MAHAWIAQTTKELKVKEDAVQTNAILTKFLCLMEDVKTAKTTTIQTMLKEAASKELAHKVQFFRPTANVKPVDNTKLFHKMAEAALDQLVIADKESLFKVNVSIAMIGKEVKVKTKTDAEPINALITRSSSLMEPAKIVKISIGQTITEENASP